MTKLHLAPYVDAAFRGKKLFFGFGSLRNIIDDPHMQKALITIAHLWKKPKTENEIQTEAQNSNLPPMIADLVQPSIHFLMQSNYLMRENEFDSSQRHSRNSLYFNLNGAAPRATLERLKSKHVLVVGAGGIGNYVASSLIGMGVGAITIVDDDHVELSNLGRQIMFTENDVGKSKVTRLVEALKSRNSETNVQGLVMHMISEESMQSLPRADLIVLSADTPSQIVNWTNRYCIKSRIPYVNVGYVMDIAVWGPFVIPGKTGCYECQKIIATEDHEDKNLETKLREIAIGYRPPSIGPINMLASSGALLDIIKFLGDFGEIASLNKRIGIWTDHLRIETQDCSKNLKCKVCGDL